MFQNKFPVLDITDNFSVMIKLPESSVIANENDLKGTGFKPVEPEGIKGSDGRHIFVKWIIKKAKLGQTLDISLIYEEAEFDTTAVTTSIIVLIIIVLIGFFYNKKRSKKACLFALFSRKMCKSSGVKSSVGKLPKWDLKVLFLFQ